MVESKKETREQRRRAREYEARVVVNDVRTDRRRRDNLVGISALVVVAVVAVASQLLFATTGQQVAAPAASTTSPVPATTQQYALPSPELAENREWSGTLTLNDSVPLGITLDGAAAPQAASNFISLAQSGYYTGTPCHRLTTEGLFVLQCGDPTGTGTGGPGYSFGPLENVPADGVYPAGTIAMARGQAEDSMGSQFFIVYQDTQLPAPGYTILGQVTSGLDQLVSQIVSAGVTPVNGPGDGSPVVPTTLTSVTVG